MSVFKNFYIMAGKSGSGKDSISDVLCKEYGLKKVISYTTRPKRKNEDNTHIFVSKATFDTFRNDLVAYTLFNGNEYGATHQQVGECDLYILDKKGIEYFIDSYKGDKTFKIIYINVDESDCKARMLMRGDNKHDILKRVENDRIEFEGVEKYADFIAVNDNFNDCVENIWKYIQKCESEGV